MTLKKFYIKCLRTTFICIYTYVFISKVNRKYILTFFFYCFRLFLIKSFASAIYFSLNLNCHINIFFLICQLTAFITNKYTNICVYKKDNTCMHLYMQYYIFILTDVL